MGAEAEQRLERRLGRLAAVEPEDELVEVGLEVRPPDPVMGPDQPRFQVRDDPVGERHDLPSLTDVALDPALVAVAKFPGGHAVSPQGIRADHRAGFDVPGDEVGDPLTGLGAQDFRADAAAVFAGPDLAIRGGPKGVRLGPADQLGSRAGFGRHQEIEK
jgi:hypothetical protein